MNIMKEKILKLRKEGLSYKKIQKILGCSLGTIGYHCKINGLNTPLENPNKISKDDIKFIKSEYQNRTAGEISKILNISVEVVRKYGGKKYKISNKKYDRTKYEIICLNCGNSIKGHKNQKFCCGKCSSEYIHKEAYKKFCSGDGNYSTGYYTPKSFKDFFLKEQGNKCPICGNEPIWMGKKLVFVIDHIDGDCSNNKRQNIRFICPNCDSQTDTFKSKTKNSKRRDYIRENIEKKLRTEYQNQKERW